MAYGLTDTEAKLLASNYLARRSTFWQKNKHGKMTRRGKEAALEFLIGAAAGRIAMYAGQGHDPNKPEDVALLTGLAFLASVRGPDEAMAPVIEQARKAGWSEKDIGI